MSKSVARRVTNTRLKTSSGSSPLMVDCPMPDGCGAEIGNLCIDENGREKGIACAIRNSSNASRMSGKKIEEIRSKNGWVKPVRVGGPSATPLGCKNHMSLLDLCEKKGKQ